MKCQEQRDHVGPGGNAITRRHRRWRAGEGRPVAPPNLLLVSLNTNKAETAVESDRAEKREQSQREIARVIGVDYRGTEQVAERSVDCAVELAA